MTTVLDEFVLLPGWSEVPFRSVAKKVSESGFPDLESLSVFLDAGVVPRASREDNHNQLGESLDKYQRVQPNDLVFNKLRTWQGGFGISNYEGIVSPAYIIARPNLSLIEPRFLGYLMKSKPYLAELTRLSKWMPPTQFDISWESIRDIKIRIPTLEDQKRISNFLDEQTKIIDRIIELTLDLNLKSLESLQSSISHLYKNIADKKIPIRHLVKNVRANYSSLLPTVSLDLVNSKRGTLNTDDLPQTDGSTATFMEAGDVAFGKLRPYLGKVFVAEMKVFAESEFIVMKPHSSKISGAYLRDFLLTNDSLQLLESLSFGAKMPRTSWEQLASLQIPTPTLKRQIEISTEIQKLTEQASQRDLLANKLLTTLIEYKSSLITTSILGQYNSHNGRSVA